MCLFLLHVDNFGGTEPCEAADPRLAGISSTSVTAKGAFGNSQHCQLPPTKSLLHDFRVATAEFQPHLVSKKESHT
jgi:hypothetical protein